MEDVDFVLEGEPLAGSGYSVEFMEVFGVGDVGIRRDGRVGSLSWGPKHFGQVFKIQWIHNYFIRPSSCAYNYFKRFFSL